MLSGSKLVRRKNRRKGFRVFLQICIIAVALGLALEALVFTPKYRPAQGAQATQREQGFIALSYFGVAPEGTETLISQNLLAKHLDALKAAGYQTISQQDILDYYRLGKALPERSLFLFFEDGRRESALLAQRLLQRHNYLASMFSYANNLDGRNSLFLSARDLKSLEDTTFWELGTHGYRLSYINVFDRHENYLGELTPAEYYHISPYVRRKYNHYLMDYLRDQYDIPMETHAQMQKRVAEDYKLMESEYVSRLGYLPTTYSLMHSNTGQFATNGSVSDENEALMSQYFAMNFNREMYCVNDLACEIYDLTRMQPQAYWSTNHLLMRIAYDTGETLAFLPGDAEKAARWQLKEGAAEHDGTAIYLTSLPEGMGRIFLKDSAGLGAMQLTVRLLGNKMGLQAVDLWQDDTGDSYIAVEIQNNILHIRPYVKGEPGEALFELNLDVHDGVVYQTMEQNRQEAMTVEIAQKQQQTYRPQQSEGIAQDLQRAKNQTTVVDNSPYIPEITLKDAGDRKMEILLEQGKLTVRIDGKDAVAGMQLPEQPRGGIALRSAWAEYGYSQRNLADDVYDGVFVDLVVTRGDGTALLDNRTTEELPRLQQQLQAKWNETVEWIRSKVDNAQEDKTI